MLRSMYSGISGMKVNQTKLDVIGNNIANVNTTSFKSSRATFSDLLSQSSSSAQASSATKGGINAKQVGLGVQLSSIDRIMTQGSMQTTSRSLDLGLDGNGYFMVSTGPVISKDGAIQVNHGAGTHSINETTLSASGASISYTRDGSFTLDNEGNLLTTDGYRVLGYSVTNDDNSQDATGIDPKAVKVGSLNFKFGAGTQLNGCKIQLGVIGPGTPTSASLTGTGNSKVLTINGDFSDSSNISLEQIQRAINTELATKGISQSVEVNGNVPKFENLGSETTITGGTNAVAPETVPCFGYRFEFGEGSELNGWKIKIGSISESREQYGIERDRNGNGGTIVIYENFLDSSVSGNAISNKINAALEREGISQKIKSVKGEKGPLTSLKAENLSLTAPKKNAPLNNVNGFNVIVDSYGKALNGKEIEFKNDTNAKYATGFYEIDLNTPNKIIITGDLGAADATTKMTTQLNNKLRSTDAYSNVNIRIEGAYDNAPSVSKTFDTLGVDSETKTFKVGGLNITLPSTEELIKNKSETEADELIRKLSSLTFRIASIDGSATSVSLNNLNQTCVDIKGDFTGGTLDVNTIKQDLQTLLTTLGVNAGANLSKLKVEANGTNTFNNLVSDPLSGGTDLNGGSSIQALGLTFSGQPKAGDTFNGYSIVIGDINGPVASESNSNGVSVSVNKTSKKIVISGNFAGNAVTTQDINTALRRALENEFGQGKFIQADEQSNVSLNLDGNTVGDEVVTGGTSVQSIAGDGTIRFVSASTTVKAYDNSLKTLKIPEKVLSADGKTEVAVKSYSIASNGVITATLQDGTIAALGQIALASFSNPAGLTSVGGNLYSVSSNSGSATIMSGLETTGENNSDAYGNMLAGYLEMSNVDLAEQFTDMITTTKAFQGASKMITTGDEILTEIINLKR